MNARTREIVVAWAPVAVLPPLLLCDAAMDDKELPITWWRVLAVIVACLPLVVRRQLPFAIFAPLITAGIVLALFAVEPGNTVVVLPMVALLEYGMRGDRRKTFWAGLGVIPCVMVGVIPFADDVGQALEHIVRNVALCALALAAGDVVRSRREAHAARAAQRIDDERLRIAREIHDTVAHAMVAINVQAGVAGHLIERDPAHARSALREIKDASGAALADLRATLGVLRGTEAAPTAPAVTLDRLDDLGAGLRAAGVAVDIRVDAERLPASTESAVYRIVQEALTNVLRHASATSVSVAVTAAGDAVDVRVVDDGEPRGDTAGSGQGLRGMRERAEALGGEVSAGPAERGGWTVHARLPLAAEGATA